jgi:hypothetical protein
VPWYTNSKHCAASKVQNNSLVHGPQGLPIRSGSYLITWILSVDWARDIIFHKIEKFHPEALLRQVVGDVVRILFMCRDKSRRQDPTTVQPWGLSDIKVLPVVGAEHGGKQHRL